MKKRTRKKLWFLLDIFFLGLPILMLLFYMIICLFGNSSLGTAFDSGVSIQNFWSYIINSNEDWSDNGIFWLDSSREFWVGAYDFVFSNFSSIFDYTVLSIFDFITGFAGYDYITFVDFFVTYFSWLLSYEFIKMFVNIIVWIPRWLNEKLSSIGGGVDD